MKLSGVFLYPKKENNTVLRLSVILDSVDNIELLIERGVFMNKNVLSTSYITKVAILAAISTLLMFILEFPRNNFV